LEQTSFEKYTVKRLGTGYKKTSTLQMVGIAGLCDLILEMFSANTGLVLLTTSIRKLKKYVY